MSGKQVRVCGGREEGRTFAKVQKKQQHALAQQATPQSFVTRGLQQLNRPACHCAASRRDWVGDEEPGAPPEEGSWWGQKKNSRSARQPLLWYRQRLAGMGKPLPPMENM